MKHSKKIYNAPHADYYNMEAATPLATSILVSIDGSTNIITDSGQTGDGSDAASKYNTFVDFQPWEEDLWDITAN